jgi:uncharacterized protein YegP (UPF0339 family)
MFEIFKDKSGGFRFRLKSKKDDIVLLSEGYTQKTNCQKGVSSVKRNSKNEDRFDLRRSENKKWYFNLKAGNGQIVATSQLHESEAKAQDAIKEIVGFAPTASITDLSK